MAGGLPDSTERRLESLLADGLTTSSFGASALAAAVAEGIEPIGQVVGISAYHMQFGVRRRTHGPAGRLPVGSPMWHELPGPVRSWAAARQRALARLSEQASRLGADAVLGIRAERDLREGEHASMAFAGTAVRISEPRRKAKDPPVLALTSPQEYGLLRRAGVEIVGIVGSFSSVQVQPGRQTRRLLISGWRRRVSQELDDLTTGVYEARRLAVERLLADARQVHASGVIGVRLEESLADPKVSPVRTTFTVHLLGTAIRRHSGAEIRPAPVVGLGT